MKKLIFFLLLSVSCWSQTTGFVARHKNLVWENVVITNETNIPALIARHPRLAITSSNKTLHKGTGTLFKNTCPGASAFMDFEFSFDFEIEAGDGKYRVTVSNLVYHTVKGKKTAAEKYFLEKGLLKHDEISNKDLNCLDAYLNRIFTMTQLYKNKM